jgi:hypothetical protein
MDPNSCSSPADVGDNEPSSSKSHATRPTITTPDREFSNISFLSNRPAVPGAIVAIDTAAGYCVTENVSAHKHGYYLDSGADDNSGVDSVSSPQYHIWMLDDSDKDDCESKDDNRNEKENDDNGQSDEKVDYSTIENECDDNVQSDKEDGGSETESYYNDQYDEEVDDCEYESDNNDQSDEEDDGGDDESNGGDSDSDY